MFPFGMPVVVVKSNKSKGSGPKVGSLGFVSYCRHSYASIQSNFALTRAEVVFSRFGFEEKERVERKPFVAMVPIRTQAEGIDDAWIENRMKILEKSTEDWGRLYSCVKEYLGLNGSFSAGLLVPMDMSGTDLIGCSDKMFITWLDSHLRAEAFIMMMEDFSDRVIDQARTQAPIDIDYIQAIRRALFEKDHRRELVRACLDKESHRQSIISHIRTIRALHHQKYPDHSVKSARRDIDVLNGRWYDFKTEQLQQSLLNVLVPATFSTHYGKILEELKPLNIEKKIAKGDTAKSVSYLIKNYNAFRDIMKNMYKEVVNNKEQK